MRVIEDVVELPTKFQLHALCNGKRFGSAHVDLPRARPAKKVTRRVAEFSSRLGKRCRINPLPDSPAPWRSERDPWNQVRTLRAGGTVRRRVAAGQKHVDGETGAS